MHLSEMNFNEYKESDLFSSLLDKNKRSIAFQKSIFEK